MAQFEPSTDAYQVEGAVRDSFASDVRIQVGKCPNGFNSFCSEFGFVVLDNGRDTPQKVLEVARNKELVAARQFGRELEGFFLEVGRFGLEV